MQQDVSNPSPVAAVSSQAKLPVQHIQTAELELGNLIGEGGFGVVYKATWQGLPVAVKKLHLKNLSSATKKEFEQESQMMANCQFPYVVRLFGISLEASGSSALVMEYMAKGSLYDVLHDTDQNLPLALRWSIATDIGRGINYLHSRNIIHRDIKSHNVFLDENYRAKVGDFGLAKVKVETTLTTKIDSKNTAGTIRWKAPELFKPKSKHSIASDIYSYGVVIWEIASRKVPFGEEAEDIVKDWVKEGAREDIPEDCSPILGKLIEQCWAQDPDKRPKAMEVVKELEGNIPKAEVAQEKSWHFDSALKIPASAMKEDYAFLDAGNKDITKVISYYQHHPVPGMDIKSVKVLYNPGMNRQFEAELRKLQNRSGKEAFKSAWSQENHPEWRAKVNAQLEEKAKQYADASYPNVKLIPLWHGTKTNLIPDICQTGYANLAKTDSGYFGKGIYSAYEAEYSYRVYSKGALVLNWVAVFSAYPVIDGDMTKLLGGANHQNYDAHFAPVVPKDPHNPKEVVYYPCRPEQKSVYTELVVFQSTQCLPRYLVELQPSLQKGLPLKPKTHTQVLKETLQYAYQHYLSLPYDAPGGADRDYVHQGITIYRPNHGLAHSLRCVFYAPLIAEAYNKMNLAKQLSQEDIERIQIALVFHVAGRRNDMSSMDDEALYQDARQRSADAFELYVKSELANKFPDEICQFYKEAIRGLSGLGKDDPRKLLLYFSHYLDLPRCLKKEICEGINRSYEDVLDKDAINQLVAFVKQCLIKTGDRIIGERSYQGEVFIESSRNIDVCMNHLKQVTLELKEKQKAEAEAKVKAEKEAKKQVKAELLAKIKAEAEKKAQEEAQAKAKQEAKLKALEAEKEKLKEQELAEAKAKADAALKAKEESEAKAKADAEIKAKVEADAKAKEINDLSPAKTSVSLFAPAAAAVIPVISPQLSPAANVDPAEVTTLLKWVTESDLNEVESFLQRNPKLALAKGTIKDRPGRIFENITAFQLAVWYLDDEMWEIILRYLDKTEAAKQLYALENDRKDIHENYGKHFDFDPLLNAYDTYTKNFDSWSWEQRDTHWCQKIGDEQRRVPAWYIYAFCEEGKNVPWMKMNFGLHKKIKRGHATVTWLRGPFSVPERCAMLRETFAVAVCSSTRKPHSDGPHCHDAVVTLHFKRLQRLVLGRLQTELQDLSNAEIKAKNEADAKAYAKEIYDFNPAKTSASLFAPAAAAVVPAISAQFSPAVNVDPAEVSALLKWVVEGHLVMAEKLLQKNPKLALARGTLKDLAERTFENITAFQYAVWSLDDEMWEIVLKYLDKSEAAKQLEALENDRTDIHEKYGKHFDFDPLLNAYDTYIKNYASWNKDQLDTHCCKQIGGEQRKVPAWYIFAFCERGLNVPWVKGNFTTMKVRRVYPHLIQEWVRADAPLGLWTTEWWIRGVAGQGRQAAMWAAFLHASSLQDGSRTQLLKSRQTEQLGKLRAVLKGLSNVEQPSGPGLHK